MIKKAIASLLLATQLPMAAIAQTPTACDNFLDKQAQQEYFFLSLEKTCFVGKSAEYLLEGFTYLGTAEHPELGQVTIYEAIDGQSGVIVLDDEFVALMQDGNEIAPVAVMAWAVGADLAILTAWMLTDMYSKM